MAPLRYLLTALLATQVLGAACPFMTGEDASPKVQGRHSHAKRQDEPTAHHLQQYEVDDSDSFMTSEGGTPVADQNSLSIGERGPSLLEDFVLREKIQHFDHERVPERAVHARGAGAHGVFTSYADWSNLTAASFLGAEGKETPVFLRFSTVAGSRGSADTVRDVHGYAVRFYTDEGNYDIVGNNVPVFFIQDAIRFPDLIHAVKPSPDSEMPQAATAHDSAWDFFSQQPSSLHALFWAMGQNGIPRSYRHTDGFGVHTFRFVTNEGKSKLVKFHFKTLQGKSGLVWEEAQVTSGKNPDFHRKDLWESIEKGRYPEWDFAVQVMDEEDQLRFGFDVLDPTKLVPEELVPLIPLGKLTLNRNPTNYFAETEQIMFQPGHVVRGIDFSDDPLLQGRLFSYMDTQLNRNGGPNFEQLPINRPVVPTHNNYRDGAGQTVIHTNNAAYSPNTLHDSVPRQADQTEGRGFFTAPKRQLSGTLMRQQPATFADVWSQPRLFYNSLPPVEKQFLVNALKFETSLLTNDVVKKNVLLQLNRVDHEIAVQVASNLDMEAPPVDPTYYHDNVTVGMSVFEQPLQKLDGMKVAILTSSELSPYESVRLRFAASGVDFVVVGETLSAGIDQTYATSDATQYDGVIIDASSAGKFQPITHSPHYPSGRPLSVFLDAYRWGKPVGITQANESVSGAILEYSGIPADAPGVFLGSLDDGYVSAFEGGLKMNRYLSRFTAEE